MKKSALFIAAVVALTSLSAPVATQPPAGYVDGEILIQFRDAAGPGAQEGARALVGAVRKQLVRRGELGDLELAAIAPGRVAAALAALQRHPAVAFAEPNWIHQHQATPNDPYYTGGSPCWAWG